MVPPPPLPPTSALDAQALARLRELDPSGRTGLVTRVLQAYEGSLVRSIAQLREARAAGDANAARQLAHTLKSSSASVGALALSDLSAQVERHVREQGPAAELSTLLQTMIDEAERVAAAVQAQLAA